MNPVRNTLTVLIKFKAMNNLLINSMKTILLNDGNARVSCF